MRRQIGSKFISAFAAEFDKKRTMIHATSLLIWLATFGADPLPVSPFTQDIPAGGFIVPPSPAVFSTEDSGFSNSQTGFQPTAYAQTQPQVGPPPLIQQSPSYGYQPNQGEQSPPFFSWESFDNLLREFNPFATVDLHLIDGYYDPYGNQASYGTNGYQPWRLGWTTYNDITYIPGAPTNSSLGSLGKMQVTQWNSYVRYSHMLAPGVVFNGTGYFNAQWWQGPGQIPLPGQVDQISTDLELGLFDGEAWTAQIAFHPQIVESYDARTSPYAFNFDGRAIATYRADQNWSFVGGVAFWDRVNVLVVPHVGVIWTPNDRWEVRALFPKSRISYFVGRTGSTDVWAYGSYEYAAESWQVDMGPSSMRDRVQIVDQTLALGMRWDSGRYSMFVEGGYVFDRHATFLGPDPNFSIGNMGMVRTGLRY